MNRLITLSIIVALLMATSVQGQTYIANTSPLEIQIYINGNQTNRQIFAIGETITINCDLVASAVSSGTLGYQQVARVKYDFELYDGDPPVGDPRIPINYDTGVVYNSSSISISVNEQLTIDTINTAEDPLPEGSYTIKAASYAWAGYHNWSIPIWPATAESVAEDLTFEVVEALPVDIDIKPGSDPNPINPGSNGVIPVAIFTTDVFDAADVDPATVTLAGADVAVRGKSEKLMAHLEDVDGDGDIDLLLQVDTQSEEALWEEGDVVLKGLTYGGIPILGSDCVVIVPPE